LQGRLKQVFQRGEKGIGGGGRANLPILVKEEKKHQTPGMAKEIDGKDQLVHGRTASRKYRRTSHGKTSGVAVKKGRKEIGPLAAAGA